MPRANRYFLPGHIWHLTHRCHRREFLLGSADDRSRYLYWLREARKRFGLCVLDYVVTSNHVHLLVKDTGEEVIRRSMQLVAGRTAQEHNRRLDRNGAFWEDRYHATAVEAGEHLHRCLAYIDLNMVRAGVVCHPTEWAHGGYRELQHPWGHGATVDLPAVSDSCGFANVADFQEAHRDWIAGALARRAPRAGYWSTAIAVGSRPFVERLKRDLGIAGRARSVSAAGVGHALSEPRSAYRCEASSGRRARFG